MPSMRRRIRMRLPTYLSVELVTILLVGFLRRVIVHPVRPGSRRREDDGPLSFPKIISGTRSCSAALADVERAQELAPRDTLPKAIAAWCWSQRAAHAGPASGPFGGSAGPPLGAQALAPGCE